jgi:hypothetical protein
MPSEWITVLMAGRSTTETKRLPFEDIVFVVLQGRDYQRILRLPVCQRLGSGWGWPRASSSTCAVTCRRLLPARRSGRKTQRVALLLPRGLQRGGTAHRDFLFRPGWMAAREAGLVGV